MNRIKTTFPNQIEVQHVFHTKPAKDGKHLIYLRFYIRYKTILVSETTVSTGIKINPERWNGSSLRGTDVQTKFANEKLSEILTTVNDALHTLKKLKVPNVATIKQEIENGIKVKVSGKAPKGQKALYLSKVAEHTLVAVKDNYLTTVQVSTTYRKNFRLAIQKFMQWWEIVYGTTTVPTVSEITPTDIQAFNVWIYQQKGIKPNTATTYLNRLRTMFLHAVTCKLISESPIPKGTIEDYQKGAQVALTVDELLRIQNIPDATLTPSMVTVKYCFLLMCSTGMGYGELKSLQPHHIECSGNDYTITKDRNKNGVEFTLPLSPAATQIYTTIFNPQSFQSLPRIEYILRKVKALARLAGIDKNITTYVGRKTFATQWVMDGNNLYYLSKILGHTQIKTTEKYVNVPPAEMMDYTRKAYTRNAFHNFVTLN